MGCRALQALGLAALIEAALVSRLSSRGVSSTSTVSFSSSSVESSFEDTSLSSCQKKRTPTLGSPLPSMFWHTCFLESLNTKALSTRCSWNASTVCSQNLQHCSRLKPYSTLRSYTTQHCLLLNSTALCALLKKGFWSCLLKLCALEHHTALRALSKTCLLLPINTI